MRAINFYTVIILNLACQQVLANREFYIINQNFSPISISEIITPNHFKKGSDSDRIEKAIIEALKLGVNSIQIPRYDNINKKEIWLIDRAIVVPSDFTLILNDCLVRLAKGTQDNIITNSGARTEPLSENRNIRIIGQGNAVLSGGLEAHFDPPGDVAGYRTIGILLNETMYFTIDGIKMEETQAWAILADGCAYGRISNIDFNNSAKYPNQDGIDLKCCHDIIIENITGITGDDMIALGGSRSDENQIASKSKGTVTQRMSVGRTGKMKDDNIYNISVSNIKGTTVGNCAIIRLLNNDGVKMYNIFINNIMDTSKEGERGNSRAIVIGDVRYWTIRMNQMGETSRIFINNVVSRAPVVIQVRGSLTNSIFNNIVGYGENNQVIEYWDKSQIENVIVDTHKF
jgi:polygalacturonase